MNDPTPTPDDDDLLRRALQAEAEGVQATDELLDRTLAAARRPAVAAVPAPAGGRRHRRRGHRRGRAPSRGDDGEPGRHPRRPDHDDHRAVRARTTLDGGCCLRLFPAPPK